MHYNTSMDEIDTIIELLKSLVKGKFYGSIELKLENGKFVLARKTESIKL